MRRHVSGSGSVICRAVRVQPAPQSRLPHLRACSFLGMMWLARQLRIPGGGDHDFHSFRRLLLTSVRFFSQSGGHGGAPLSPREPVHFMVDYLVSLCGVSASEALRAAKPLAHLRSPEKPDAVLRFLRQEGLSDADIKHAVLRFPRVLLADVKKTLEPKIKAGQGAGFSRSEVTELISTSPRVIFGRDLRQRIDFWRELVGTNQNFLKTLKRDQTLICRTVSGAVTRLSLLRSLGVPDSKMRAVVVARPRLVFGGLDRINSVVERVRSLGFSPGSPIFVQALLSISNLSTSTFNAKSKLLRSFGWTETELMHAIQKFPTILRYSEERISAVLNFLLNVARWERSYIARHPTLVGYSLEKRLIPRFYVLQSLKVKGLLSESKILAKAIQISEDDFVQRYIVRFSDELPELLEAYQAVLAKKAEANIDN